jgi:hypothetical protein
MLLGDATLAALEVGYLRQARAEAFCTSIPHSP